MPLSDEENFLRHLQFLAIIKAGCKTRLSYYTGTPSLVRLYGVVDQ